MGTPKCGLSQTLGARDSRIERRFRFGGSRHPLAVSATGNCAVLTSPPPRDMPQAWRRRGMG
jgi:hypothetical protein